MNDYIKPISWSDYKDDLIAGILERKSNHFTKEELEHKSIRALEMLFDYMD